MSTAQPNLDTLDQQVRVEVTETLGQLNARGPMTADQFFQFAALNGRCQLWQGKVQMMSPAGSEHGYIANQIAFLLTQQVRSGKLGRVYAAETGFLIARSPDTVRAPDVAFIAKDRLSTTDQGRGFSETIPDLVVEVISPTERSDDVADKTQVWLEAGVRCVLNVDPTTRVVTVYRSDDEARTFGMAETLDLSWIIPTWRPAVASFFESDI